MGEPGGLDCTAEQEKQQNSNKVTDSLHMRHTYSDEDIKSSFADCNRGNFVVLDDKTSDYQTFFVYEQWKLTHMEFKFHTGVLGNVGEGDALLEDASKRFGTPTSKRDVVLQNGFGAHWTDTFYSWDIPTGHVEVYIAGRAAKGEDWGTIEAQTKESWDKRLAQLAQRKSSLD